MSQTRIYRQGDVLLIEARMPEDEVTAVARDDGKLVLAYGEFTGHSHAIAEQDAYMVQFANGERYLRVGTSVQVRHQEHLPVVLPPGTFKVIIQREYVPGPVQYREVAD